MKKDETTDAGQPDLTGAASSSVPGAAALTWSNDPKPKSVYLPDRLNYYQLFTTMRRENRNTETIDNANYPFSVDSSLNIGGNLSRRYLVQNDTTIEQAIMDQLNRVITTPGNLSYATISAEIREYLGYVCRLLSIYYPLAALWGLTEEHKRQAGPMKSYLAAIKARDWQVRDMEAVLSTLPMPTTLNSLFKEFHSVKMAPNGLPLFWISQPVAMTTDEDPGRIGAEAMFKEQWQHMHTNVSDFNELLRILEEAGWSTYDFTANNNRIPIIRDGFWWDCQVTGIASGRVDDASGHRFVAHPYAGYEDRAKAIGIYSGSDLWEPYFTKLIGGGVWGTHNAAGFIKGDLTYGDYFVTSDYRPDIMQCGYTQLAESQTTSAGAVYMHGFDALNVGQLDWMGMGLGWTHSAGGLVDIEANGIVSLPCSYMNEWAAGDYGVWGLLTLGWQTGPANNLIRFGNTVDPNIADKTGHGTGTENQAAYYQIASALLM